MVPAGWYPDPWGHAPVRWFDGTVWTAHLRNAAGWYPDPYQEADLRWFDGREWTTQIHRYLYQPAFSTATPVAPPGKEPETLSPHTAQPSGSPVGAEAPPAAPQPQSVPAVRHAGRPGSRQPIAAVSIRTSGVGPDARIVEIAVANLDEAGNVTAEFETLIDPVIDPGPAWLHGLSPQSLSTAPRFSDVAAIVADRLDQSVLVAHNATFITHILGREVRACGINIDWGSPIDTLAVGPSPLALVCAEHQITLPGVPSAIRDARGSALLAEQSLLVGSNDQVPVRAACAASSATVALVTRPPEALPGVVEPYLVRLSSNFRPRTESAGYGLLLGAATSLPSAGSSPQELSSWFGLSVDQQRQTNREFIDHVVGEALADEVLSSAQRAELMAVADILGVELESVVLSSETAARTENAPVSISPGMAVCVVDGGIDSMGTLIGRDQVEAAAEARDLVVVGSPDQHCDVVVADDPGKVPALDGVPIVKVAGFLLGVDERVPVPALRISRAVGVDNTCRGCGRAWTASREADLCSSCRRDPRASRNQS